MKGGGDIGSHNVWKDIFGDLFCHQGDWEHGCVNGHDVVTLGRDILEHVMFSTCRSDSSKHIVNIYWWITLVDCY